MRINFTYILISALFLMQSCLFSQWTQQTSGVNYALKSVYFVNENTGYSCGYNTILKTTNGGTNWVRTILQGNHNNIKFTGEQTGFVCSDSGKIFITTNGGNTWNLQQSGVTSNLQSMSFVNSLTGIITGYGKTILKTTNGGTTWFNIANFVWEIDLLGCKVLDENNYYVSGNNSFIMRTTNGGSNWNEYTHGEVNPLFTVEFINENTGWSTGCCGMFMTTTNGGTNWTYEYYLSLGFTFYSMQFISQQTGYVTGDNGMVYRTTNGGLWWDSTVSGTDQSIYSIHMLNANTGWIVGGFGSIYKTTNGGGTGYTIGITQISAEVPKSFELFQNYPNPFNPATKIKFQIPNSGYASLKIFDMLGNEIEALFSGHIKQGIYEAELNASAYPSGAYFCKLEFNGLSITKKMVLIK